MTEKSKSTLVSIPMERAPARVVDPPDHLDEEGKRQWIELQSQFHLDDAPALTLLSLHVESLMEARSYRQRIEDDGAVYHGHPHPLIAPMHRAERIAMAALRALELEDDDGPRRIGRPPGTRRGV